LSNCLLIFSSISLGTPVILTSQIIFDKNMISSKLIIRAIKISFFYVKRLIKNGHPFFFIKQNFLSCFTSFFFYYLFIFFFIFSFIFSYLFFSFFFIFYTAISFFLHIW